MLPDPRTLLSFSRLTKGNRERLLDALLACGRPVHSGDLESVITPHGSVVRVTGRSRTDGEHRPTLSQIRREVADFMSGDYSIKTVCIPSMNAFELTSNTDSSDRIILTVYKFNHYYPLNKTLMNKEKELYEAPDLTVIDVKTEGVICASGENVIPDNPFGGDEDIW